MHAPLNKPFSLYAVRWRYVGDDKWRLYLIDSPGENAPSSPVTFTFLDRAIIFSQKYACEYRNIEAEPVEIRMELFPAW